MVGAFLRERRAASARAAAAAIVERLGLGAKRDLPASSLTLPDRKRLEVARALATRPRLLLLDEVLNGLDEINRARMLRWLARQTGRLPWVLATHRLEDVPPSATHALLLRRGRIVYRGALRGAPLKRWLEYQPRESPPGSARRAARPGGRSLVRLSDARVYLEGRRVLDGISLTVRAGECWIIHGPNGSGKTTLLRTLYGDHGVAVGGAIERAGVGPGVALEAFRKRVGLVAPHLQADHPAQLTVAEVVQSGRHASVGLNDAPSAADRSVARRTLALFALTRLSTRTLGELSYGQSRRVLFARAWVREPELLLLDEPFAGVDAPTRRALTQRVLALAALGTAVVMSAHRPGDWLGCASHELELAGGCALYSGPIRPLLERRRRLAGAAR